jgi:plastocyanin
MRRLVTGAGALAAGLLLAACGSGSSGGGSVAAPAGQPSSAPAESSTTDTVAGLTANDHGTKDVSGMRTFTIEADNYYFDPTVLKGTPGQQLTLVIKNTSSTQHNFTLKAQNVNKDLDAGKSATTHVTFPASGVLSFYCEYHKSMGMDGGVLTSGDKAGTAGGAATSSSSSSSSGGGAGWG